MDLRQVRAIGLVRLRQAPLVSLRSAAVLAGVVGDDECGPAALEELLRRAMPRLGGRLQEAAEYVFGLVQGTRDWPPQDRRSRAAETYRVSVDRFRKHYEKIIHAQTAEAILALIADAGARAHPRASRSDIEIADDAAVSTATPAEYQRIVDVAVAGAPVRVHVHCGSVELLEGIDIVVCPINTYFELANTYKHSVAACLRWAGTRRSITGEILRDSPILELDRWRLANTRPGLPVAPGTIAPTGVDPESELRYRRIYYAAVAAPRAGTNDYHVEPPWLVRAVRNAFRAAHEERHRFNPALSSFCFPLLGAGRGGLTPAVSFFWIWDTVVRELEADRTWEVHFVAIRPADATLVCQALVEPEQRTGKSGGEEA